MNEKWIKDIMSQKFLNSDITRLIMLRAFVQDKVLKGVYKKTEVLEYIYRVYSDNESIRILNPNVIIRHINRYGVSDIKDILELTIDEWKNNAPNAVLFDDERFIFLRDVDESPEMGILTYQLCDMLNRKYFTEQLKEPKILDLEVCKQDTNIVTFGKSLYRNRVFEDLQYCPLCEESNIEDLYVVHILPAKYCTDNDLCDKNNGLIMCSDHSKDYISGNFVFKENGFVKNIRSSIVHPAMHLSVSVKTPKRREYIKKRLEIEKEKEHE